VNYVYKCQSVDKTEINFPYRPDGSTNLNDAVVELMNFANFTNFLVSPENRSAVTMFIITDGYENSSVFYKKENVKEMSEMLKACEYSFRYFGADVDAFNETQSYGFTGGMSFNKQNTEFVGASMSNYMNTRSSFLSRGAVSASGADMVYNETHSVQDSFNLNK
jgi:hypothetical protein